MKWHVKTAVKIRGPFSFQELTAHIRKGRIEETTPVREESATEWMPAVQVPGLFRMAASERKEVIDSDTLDPETPLSPAPESKIPVRQNKWRRNINRSDVLKALALLGVMAACSFAWISRDRTFPAPKPIEVIFNNPDRRAQMMPPIPTTPTLNIPVNSPVLVPGVPPAPWAKSPSLSQDLCTLVFSAPVGERNQIQFYSRDKLNTEFGNHQILFTDLQGSKDFPALSPDGLEVLFCTYAESTKVWHSRRESTSTGFSAAIELDVSSFVERDFVLDACRWVNSNTIRLRGTGPDNVKKHLLFQKNETPHLKFTHELPIFHSYLLCEFNRKLDRGYALTKEGIQLTGRTSRNQAFVMPELIVGTEIIGPSHEPFNNPLFVTPKEDLIIYAGAGPNGGGAEHNALWMLRLH